MRRDLVRRDLLPHGAEPGGGARAHRHRRAGLGATQRDRSTDAATAAGNHRPLPGKVDFHPLRPLPTRAPHEDCRMASTREQPPAAISVSVSECRSRR